MSQPFLLMTSPFYHIPYYPPFDRMSPANAEEAFAHLLPETNAAIDALEATFTPTWNGLMQPLHDACHPLYDAWGLLNHMLSVMNSAAWRHVQEAVQPEVVAFSLRVGQSKIFYAGFKQLQSSDRKAPCLTAVQRRILDKTLQGAEQSGVGLPLEQQTRFNAIQLQLAQQTTAFRNNVLDATKAFSLVLRTPEEADGLPTALLAVAAQAARDAGETAASAPNGPWKITLDVAVYQPFMMYSRNRAARETLYRAYATRASSGQTDNTPLIEQSLALRREVATLLGYATFADLSLSNKTAKTVAAVDDLIAQLAAASRETGQREAAELLTFARANGFSETALQPWDIAFWSERQREQRFNYNEEELSRYFPFSHVLEGLFRLASRLFDIVITPADGEAPVWHDAVRFFRVSDTDGTPRACFFLDPYSRPETKSGGAWMNDFRTREKRPDGSVTLPMALIVCNQSVPVGKDVSVMRFGEVETLFHEFGHALQHMLTTVDEPEASGINGIEWDAVEIASQFMENWCYERTTLKGLSCHAETGEALPDVLFEKRVAAKNYRAATALLRQLFFAATDMDLYARYPRPEWADADAVKRLNAEKYLPTPLLPEDHFLCSFSHIFSGAYAAGYYSYKWSEVLSADAFAAFEEAGLEDAEAVRGTGRRFRDTLLALGGGTDPADVFQLFRNRAPSVLPLLRHSGLSQDDRSAVSPNP